MKGLPPGQYAEYFLIAVIAAAAGFILQSLLRARLKTAGKKVAALVGLGVLGVLGYGVVERFAAPEAAIDQWKNPPRSPSPPPSPVPTAALDPGSGTPWPQGSPAPERAVLLFLERNVAPPPASARKAGQWAVVIAEPGSANNYPKLAGIITAAISEHGQATVGLFRPPVSAEPGFTFLFCADPELIRKLNRYCDHIFVGKVTTTVNDNRTSLDFTSVTLAINVRILATRSGSIEAEFESQATGAGSSLDEALSTAEDRLADQLRARLQDSIKWQEAASR